MRVDVNGMEDWAPEKPLDPGWYTVRCAAVELKEAQSSGAPMASLNLEIMDGPEQSTGQTITDRRIFTNLMLDPGRAPTPKGQKFLSNKLAEAAVSFDAADGDGFDTDDLVGKEAEANISVSRGQDGEPRNEVKRFRPVGGFTE